MSSVEATGGMSYLPIKIESVIPQETAGTEAPLYSALGPCTVPRQRIVSHRLLDSRRVYVQHLASRLPISK